MSSNLKVNTILPSTGTNVAIGTAGGSITMVGNVDIDINSGISTFNDIHISDKIVHVGDTDTTIRFPVANQISFETTGSEAVRIDEAGRVGIGHDNPSQLLTVRGNAPIIRIEENQSGGSKRLDLGVTNSGAVGYIGANQSASSLAFQTVNNERMRITSTGKIGIGTDTFIDGNTKFEVRGKTSNTSAGGQNIHKYGSASAFHYGQYNSTGDASLNNQANALLAFATNNTERVRIQSDGKVKVGGGTASLALLHVAPANYSLNLQNNSSNKSMILFSKNGTPNDSRSWIEGNGELNGYVAIGAGDNERFRISSDGYVTKPQTPAFFATHTGASNTQTGYLVYNTSGGGYCNNGGHFNVSTGAFTAPVTGIYHFHFHGFFQTGAATGDFEVNLYRTNSDNSGTVSVARQYGNKHQLNNYGPSISLHWTGSLTAGQYVRAHTGKSFHGSNGYFFGGYLIG